MSDASKITSLFIVDRVADVVRARAKHAQPHLVWGLLFGQDDGVPGVYEVVHCTNCAGDPAARIAINYSEVKQALYAAQILPYTLLGYYISSSGRAVFHRIDKLPFPSGYYVLELAQTEGRLEWKAQRVVWDTRIHTALPLKHGTAEQIEQRIKQITERRSRATPNKNDGPAARTYPSISAVGPQTRPALNEQTSRHWLERLWWWAKSLLVRSAALDRRSADDNGISQVVSRSDATGLNAVGSQTRSVRPLFEPPSPVDTRPHDPERGVLPPRSALASLPKPVFPPGTGDASALTTAWSATSPGASRPAEQVQRAPLPLPSTSRQRRIAQFCKERGITTLVHFTRLHNLETILAFGLMPRRDLVVQCIQTARFNDIDRHDGYPTAVCLSISFPNYKTFFYWQQRYQEPWVVLGIDARVLWELDCAFCTSNAASVAMRNLSLDSRRQPRALEAMFDSLQDKGRRIDRVELSIPKNYPTHPQAEVLAFGTIVPMYIGTISFETPADLNHYQSHTTSTPGRPRLSVDPHYFSYRADYRRWQRYEARSE